MLPPRLWVYTNYDCNLRCTYCLSSSHPGASRRQLPLPVFRQLIGEAAEAGIQEVFLTGGEPFLLPEIFEYIGCAAGRLPVTVLTNALLLKGPRLERLAAFKDRPVSLQVSLDAHRPDPHEAYRGRGTWAPTVDAIKRLLALGFRVTIGATETPVNTGSIDRLRDFVAQLGIPPQDFFVRPLTRRGFSEEGVELSADGLVPELTVTAEGVYWHPQTAGDALLLSRTPFPLVSVLQVLETTYRALIGEHATPPVYRCA